LYEEGGEAALQEVEAMIGLSLEETRVYQEEKAEGKARRGAIADFAAAQPTDRFSFYLFFKHNAGR
jgi:predicted transposase YdaD